ncbi:MAG: protein kinase [Gemmataceae bacterium]|nr:protein kinase [Gemmataceae bacterium]
MEKQLVVISGGDKGRTFPLPESGSVTIGRSKDTDTSLTDARVSRKHCQIVVKGDEVVLVDAASATGTFINDQKVSEQRLISGDVIRVGNTELRFEDLDVSEAATLAGDAIARQVAAPATDISRMIGTVLGSYKIESILDPGRSSVLFRGRAVPDGPPVILKVLRPEAGERDRARFVQGMKQLVGLQHGHLLSVLNAGAEGSFAWAALEFVDGSDLTRVVDHGQDGAPRDWRGAVQMAVQVGRALEYLHKNDTLHRNVCPRAVLVGERDRTVKLGSLSHACRRSSSALLRTLRSEEILRDAEYLPPERIKEDVKGDERSDVYSLGATLHALLLGRPPYHGKNPAETLTQVMRGELSKDKDFSMLPEGLQGCLSRMLAKAPELRHATAAEAVAELERLLSSAASPSTVLRSGPGTTVQTRADRRTTDRRTRGVSVASAYEVLEEIGRGENATVFRAQDLALKRNVAIKELSEGFRRNQHRSQLFWDEAQFLAGVEHDNIAKIYGIDKESGWLIMELMRGSVGAKLADGPLPAEQVRSVLRQALAGLDFLHQHHKLHGAIKPTNLLINANGRIKLSDPAGLSPDGVVQKPKGMMKYVAPEMLNAEFGSVGPGVDLYCLGFTALELLKGAELESLLKGVGRGAIDPELGWLRLHGSRSENLPKTLEILPDAPADLARVIDRLLAKDVASRYASAAEALRDLDDAPLVLFQESQKTAQSGSDGGASGTGTDGAAPKAWSRPWINKKLTNPWVAAPLLAAFSCFFFILLFHDFSPTAPPAPPSGFVVPNYAFLVGVDDYGKELPPFPHAEADVNELARLLVVADYPSDQVVCLARNRGATDPGKFLPTGVNIRHQLQALAEKRKPNASLLLVLVGHTVQFRGNQECYFCPADARLADKSTLIPLSEIYQALGQWPGKRNVLLMDTGRPVTASEVPLPEGPSELGLAQPQKVVAPEGVFALFSCGPGGKSYRHRQSRHGAFFHYLIQGMRGSADEDSDLRCTLEEVHRYATANVYSYVNRAYGQSQRPEHAGKANPKTCLTERNEALKLYHEAIAEFNKGENEGTVVYCDEVLKRREFADVHLLRARGLYYQGKFKEAAGDFGRAIDLDPANADAYAGRAQAYLGLGENDRAWEDASKATTLDPYFAPFYGVRARVLSERKQFDQALADSAESLRLDPGAPSLYNIRGLTYLAAGKHDLALEDFAKAAQLDPALPVPFKNRGLTYEAMQRHEDAIREFTRAVKADPNYAAGYYHRARAYGVRAAELKKQGRPESEVDRAMRLARNDRETADNLRYDPKAPDR